MKQDINKESVYLLKYVGRKEVKIGMSKDLNPRKRIQQYNMYSIHGVEVLGIIQCLDSRITERKIHQEFKNKRIKGEWFELTDEDVEYIIDKYTDYEYKRAYKNFLERYSNSLNSYDTNKNEQVIYKTSEKFLDWCVDNIDADKKYNKTSLLNKYKSDYYCDIKLIRLFNWLKIYAESENLELVEGRNATERYIIFKTRS